ncbi:MAG: TonB-dependent receptor [Saprospiraceae bacterium]
MKTALTILLLLNFTLLPAQSASIKGKLMDSEGSAVIFANVALFSSKDSSLTKVASSDASGSFELQGLPAGNYFLKSNYVGMQDYQNPNIQLTSDQHLDLGILRLETAAINLTEATVTAQRSILEVKPDRLIFNVEGTINSIGSDAISLLRKAPSVTIDNNDNISLLGRSGVLVYLDGKRLPLSGQDLSNYLQNLPAEQIDRIEIITNPGAKYEAQGNAGIIDIRLKKDKNLGTNGSVNTSYIQGKYPKSNISGNGNYRNKKMNLFGTLGLGQWQGYHRMEFQSYQNNFYLDETNENRHDRKNLNYRIGTDYFLSPEHTIGFLYTGFFSDGTSWGQNRIDLASENSPTLIDSILIANTNTDNPKKNQSFNLNYRFDTKKDRNLNIDLDYAFYNNTNTRQQDNDYFDASGQQQLSEFLYYFDTPSDIDILTFKLDYEHTGLGGKLSYGTKLSRVVTDNFYQVYDGSKENGVLNLQRSNRFKYDENVYGVYVNYARSISKNWNLNAGLRAEQTDARGDLQAYLPELQEPAVLLKYLSWFPSAGINWNITEQNSMALNYSRRINRPDYNVLNPFNNQLSQLSYEKGNPFLAPEIVNNLELGYTLASRFNFKVGYALTSDQITRLIGPDDKDPRASFIKWDNLATQEIWSFNASLPIQIHKIWNAYFNLGASHIHNQADYGGDAIVDLKAFTYSIYQQHSFDLPLKFKGEISGYYSGPGIWGGVFVYESSWSLDLGLQRKFLKDRLNAKLSASDLFFTSGWKGISEFNGLRSYGKGNWDSRRLSLNLSYRFGNDNVKSRKRNVGLEDEAGRVGGD